jgi:TM2 domain-containing membrane protein YozV
MKCSKCGEELTSIAKYCPTCGEKVGEKKEKIYCSNCGKELDANIIFCSECGNKINSNNNQLKSKIAAGLLGVFLGSIGVHNFYLGYTSKGITQLLLTLFGWIACGLGPIIAGIWGLIEGILILTGSINEDANGNRLQD